MTSGSRAGRCASCARTVEAQTATSKADRNRARVRMNTPGSLDADPATCVSDTLIDRGHDQRRIVLETSAREARDVGEQRVEYGLRGEGAMCGGGLAQPRLAVVLALRRFGIGDAVRIKDEPVARLERNLTLSVGRVGEHAEHHA